MAVIECQHCGAAVEVMDELQVQRGHAASSEKPREWVIYEKGNAIHRCASGD